jgi:hypothetical protein
MVIQELHPGCLAADVGMKIRVQIRIAVEDIQGYAVKAAVSGRIEESRAAAFAEKSFIMRRRCEGPEACLAGSYGKVVGPDQPLRCVIGPVTFTADTAVAMAHILEMGFDFKCYGFTEACSTIHRNFPFLR